MKEIIREYGEMAVASAAAGMTLKLITQLLLGPEGGITLLIRTWIGLL